MTNANAWRGKGRHDEEDFIGSGRVDPRSRALLASLLQNRKKRVAGAGAVLLLRGAAAAGAPLLVKVGIDTGIPNLVDGGDATSIVWVVGALCALAMVQAVSEYSSILLVGRLTQDMLYDLRVRVFDHVQRLGIAFLERFTSGRVISRLTSDIESIDDLFTQGLMSLAWASLMMAVTVVAMFVLDWQLALLAATFGLALWLLTRWFASNALRASRKIREASAFVIIHFVESLRAVAAVQAFRRERRNEEILSDVNTDYQVAKQRNTRLVAVYGPGIRAIGNIAIAVVLVVGALRVMDGSLTIGTLAAFLLYLSRTVEPMLDLSQFYSFYQSAAAAGEKLSMLLERKPDLPEADDPVVMAECRGELEFSGVTFGYGDAPVLHEIDLHIEPGTTVALVGATGAGKSTLARLATRLYDPTAGVVSLDGLDLRSLATASLRQQVVMVTQENFLFSQTVAENISFGRPDATRAEIEQTLRELGAWELVDALPDGLDSTIGKRGTQLSAGQRQLLSFARALIANPAVLLLDEATSALDVASEQVVQRALDRVLRDRTAIVIAHRLSTVANADRVLVLDAGRIVEDGSPAELLQIPGGRYRQLHDEWRRSVRS